jgi:hypothetical protein
MPAQTAAQKRRAEDERRQRVETVRNVEKRLADLENVLLTVVARVPGMVRDVQAMRADLTRATAQPAGESK